eukprot:1156599-Pelagomonas_calceolata.AAC.4
MGMDTGTELREVQIKRLYERTATGPTLSAITPGTDTLQVPGSCMMKRDLGMLLDRYTIKLSKNQVVMRDQCRTQITNLRARITTSNA